MASKVKVNEFTTTSGSGSVAFAKGGADMTGDMSVNGTLSLDSLGGAITVKSYSQAGKPSNPSIGTVIWNTSTNRIEIWNGNLWTRMDEPGGQFPTNGLVVHLDATDTNSYNGSGTVWTDLSGNGNNFNIVASAHHADVKDLVIVATEDDANDVFSNVVDIAFHGGQQNFTSS